eukprot:CAMPEP_0198124924 /NCGR_PEP_ID=MMETSP1442-20131203/41305_1 /TAXON_ID= /ORGANISM="Craspedostauros australis, Strain CCMP3328" /LENGTH=143 /DNA_ID=CAMNT_0043784431 /DNA_START=104 /DNA_END=534 /DNA_ORIENTATION=+
MGEEVCPICGSVLLHRAHEDLDMHVAVESHDAIAAGSVLSRLFDLPLLDVSVGWLADLRRSETQPENLACRKHDRRQTSWEVETDLRHCMPRWFFLDMASSDPRWARSREPSRPAVGKDGVDDSNAAGGSNGVGKDWFVGCMD